MITAIEMIDKVFEALPTQPTKYKITQPKVLPSEFIVINSLTLQGRQRQRGVLNVNVHVKNLNIGSDNSQPNTERLKELSRDVINTLNQTWVENKLIDINESGGIFREDNGYHFVNIKINYTKYNL